MTLEEFITFTTAKLGITDSTAQQQAGEFTKARWRMIWNSAVWRQARHQDTVMVAAGAQDITLPPEFEFVNAARWESGELLPVNDLNALAMNPAGYDQAGPVANFIPLGKDANGNARLRLVSKPGNYPAGVTEKPLLVIGKRKCVDLVNPTDSPLIPGVDECLCAFVMGDLFQWIRQMNRAQVFFQEANALLAKMVEIEMAQTAEIRRIIPIEQVMDDSHVSLW